MFEDEKMSERKEESRSSPIVGVSYSCERRSMPVRVPVKSYKKEAFILALVIFLILKLCGVV